MNRTHRYFAVLTVLMLAPSTALANTIQLHPTKDNSIFSDGTSKSSGAGYTIYTGTAGDTNTGLRRALVRFDISGNVPTGATITSAALAMFVYDAAAQDTTSTRNTSLYRLTSEWGEGNSFSTGNHGIGTGTGTGANAQTNDATWLVRFFNVPSTNWTASGGDYVGTASATHAVGQPSTTSSENWQSAGMVTDVQSWVDTPAQNFGWIIRGDELTTFTTRRFYSREWQDATNFPGLYLGPLLTVQFEVTTTAPEPASCALLAFGGVAILVWRRRVSRRNELAWQGFSDE